MLERWCGGWNGDILPPARESGRNLFIAAVTIFGMASPDTTHARNPGDRAGGGPLAGGTFARGPLRSAARGTCADGRAGRQPQLGGKPANIVFDDAPPDQAGEGISNGIFINLGHSSQDKRPRSHSLRSGYAIEQGCGEIGRPEAGAEHQRSGRTDRDGAGRAVDGGGRCKAGHTGGQSQPAGGSDVVSGEDKGASPGLCHLEAGDYIRLVIIAGRRWNFHG